jgi:probable HAF family extracellular repeat protein
LEARSCPSSYSLTILSPLPGDAYSKAWGINDAGQAVGKAIPSDGTLPGHAVLWQSGSSTATDLGSLAGGDSIAWSINNAGEVVGSSGADGFLWKNGTMTDLGALTPWRINNSGMIVGSARTASGDTHAFLWRPTTPNGTTGVLTDLGTLGGTYSEFLGINDAGQVVGGSSTATGTEHAFLWQNGTMTDLGTPEGAKGSSAAYAINSSGQVAGSATFKNNSGYAALFQGGRWTDLGILGKANPTIVSVALDINDAGQAVGYSGPIGTQDAFVWQSKSGMQDLNNLIPSGSGVTLEEARKINSSGQIAGFSTGGGFVLTPTSGAASSRMAVSSSANATAASSASIMPLEMGTVSSDGTSSLFPRGPLGLVPDSSPWILIRSFSTHMRRAGGITDPWVAKGGG